MARSDTSECRGCGETIRWVKSRNGKNVPLDPTPVPVAFAEKDDEHDVEGFTLDGARVYGRTDEGGEGELYICHFETCPKSDSFRRRGGSQQRASSQARSPRGSRSSSSEFPCPHCGALIHVAAEGSAKEPERKPDAQADIPF